MSTEIRMPRLSDNMEEGTIVRWFTKTGDRVEVGDALAEVETDKADVDIEAEAAGVVEEIRVPEGESAAVGAVIAVLGEGKQSAAPRAAKSEPKAERKSTAKTKAGTSRRKRPEQDEAAADATPGPPKRRSGESRPLRASPLAWRAAEDLGVDLGDVQGTGVGGRILRRDVEKQAPPRRSQPATRAASAPDEDASTKPRPSSEDAAAGTVIEMSRVRRATAQLMSEAKRQIPHFYVTSEVDMEDGMRMRESLRESERIPGLTINHLILRALALVLPDHPRVNASWQDDAVQSHPGVSIGIAVAVEDGLVVPVLHGAEELSLALVAARASELVQKAKAGKFSGDELSGATFTLSNMGMLDIDEFSAIINPPQAALLAVGAVRARPVVRNGAVVARRTMRMTLSSDHRVLNGVEAGHFLEDLKSVLENPVLMVMP